MLVGFCTKKDHRFEIFVRIKCNWQTFLVALLDSISYVAKRNEYTLEIERPEEIKLKSR